MQREEHRERIFDVLLPSKELDKVLKINIIIINERMDAKFFTIMFIPESKYVEIKSKKLFSSISPFASAEKSPFKSSVGKKLATFCGKEFIKSSNSLSISEVIFSSISLALTLIAARNIKAVKNTINLVFFISF